MPAAQGSGCIMWGYTPATSTFENFTCKMELFVQPWIMCLIFSHFLISQVSWTTWYWHSVCKFSSFETNGILQGTDGHNMQHSSKPSYPFLFGCHLAFFFLFGFVMLYLLFKNVILNIISHFIMRKYIVFHRDGPNYNQLCYQLQGYVGVVSFCPRKARWDETRQGKAPRCVCHTRPRAHLLTWFNFNHSMDK